jgi:hypothetical protein
LDEIIGLDDFLFADVLEVIHVHFVMNDSSGRAECDTMPAEGTAFFIGLH